MNTIKAILTGHTRGLGAALADTLIARGIAVLGVSRTRSAVHASGLLKEVELDLADINALQTWIETGALKRFVDGAHTVVLINNAGMLQPVGPVEGQDVGAIGRSVSLNVAAPLMLSAAVAASAPSVLDRRIVHISSGAARNAYPGWSIYCATKAALDHHARAVALDHNRALRIGSVAPGVIDTDMQAEIRGTGLDAFPLREKFDDLKRSGQLSTPADAARKVLDYALSDAFGETPVTDVRELA
ncbi:short-chain dehydrogenase [Burkholderia sp. PAMC 28687]|jgi:benzil reductase ((S)-benzoin forming)|uniref:Short-chain dehydrogenase/reductase SDR n=1 Tax=Caballeronia sordidicola TaxID=196367 RepID=A0A242MM49_CABSO|nr:short-chain dehydrogenase [Burkholderia sp. PAMC 28687]OTP72398.1 Short-chain dehydrogenase/reductase SDR [Caballeronia sordidicola]